MLQGYTMDPNQKSHRQYLTLLSYTPIVRALGDSVKTPREFDKGRSGLFMISQPDTPRLPLIPGTTEEVRWEIPQERVFPL